MLTGLTAKIDRLAIGVLASALLLLTAVSFLVRNATLIAAGGSEWIHGEWLINFAAGPVRRGLGGETVLALANATGASALTVIGLLQGAAVLAVVAVVLLALWVKGANPRWCLLAISPAFVLSWHNSFGTHGKEIFACLAFLPLLGAALAGRGFKIALPATVVLHGFAILLHETAVLFFPFILLAGVSLLHRGAQYSLVVAYCGALTLVAAATTGFTLLNMSVPDAAPLCAAIVAGGLSDALCGTPIAWVANTGPDALQFTLSRLPTRDWSGIFATAVLAYVPMWIALRPRVPWRWLLIGTGLTILTFLPLYAVAVDYGRWLNMQISAVTLTLFIIAATGWRGLLSDPMSRRTLWIFAGLALCWRVAMVSGGIGAGVAEPLVKAILGI